MLTLLNFCFKIESCYISLNSICRALCDFFDIKIEWCSEYCKFYFTELEVLEPDFKFIS